MENKKKAELLRVKISNFKSIQSVELKIKNEVSFLVGINESGKSNILEAIKGIYEKSLNPKTDENFNVFDKNQKSKPTSIIYNFEILDSLSQEFNNLFQQKAKKNYSLSKIIDLRGDSLHWSFDEGETSVWENISVFLKKIVESYPTPWQESWKNQNKRFFAGKEKKISDIEKVIEKIKGSARREEDQEQLSLLRELIEKTKQLLDLLPFCVEYYSYEELKNIYTFAEALKSPLFIGFWKNHGGTIDEIEKLKRLSDEAKASGEVYYPFETHKENLQKSLDSKNNISSILFIQNKISFKVIIKDDRFIIGASDVFKIPGSKSEFGEFQKLKLRGKGMSYFLSLLFFFSSIDFQTEKKIIILLDEPGIHLHAEAILDLKKHLNELIEKHKNLGIVISTHNPFWIDEKNIHQINFVDKTTTKGTTLVNKAAYTANYSEEVSTLSPFLYKIGIDRESFLKLSNSIHVFVEGYSDMLLFDGVKHYFDNKYEDLFFIPTNGAGKKSTLFNVLFALNKKYPCFIFDYDQAGSNNLETIKKNKPCYYNEKLPNVIFNNLFDKYLKEDKIKGVKIETQHLFDSEEFNNKKISEHKKNDFYFNVWKALKEQKIILTEKTKKNFENVFAKIKEVTS